MSRIRLVLLFGGQSCEHEVSVTSARSMLAAIDREKYDVTLIGITKTGQWRLFGDADSLPGSGVVDDSTLPSVLLDYASGGQFLLATEQGKETRRLEADVVFPLLHGPCGEDGTMQGLFDLAGIAYVGSGVVGSAVGMDKEMARRAFAAEDLNQAAYRVILRRDWEADPSRVMDSLTADFGFPLFVKPVNMGSSVGISRVSRPETLPDALNLATQFDTKMIIEASVENAREVECAVLGNDDPKASVVGEIIPGAEFYDYQTKYIDDKSTLVIPADLSSTVAERVREMAVRAFRAVDAAGLARVDFFVRANDEIVINEINTMPGFTPISMYPKLWEASGLAYPDLIDRLITLGMERHEDRQRRRKAL